MREKLSKLISIAEQAEHSDKVEVWTQSYIVRGSLLKEAQKTVSGIVTLKNAEIFPIFCECEDTNGKIEREWLNIFEEHIISFTVVRNK